MLAWSLIVSTTARTLAAFAALALCLCSIPAGAQAQHGGRSEGHSWHGTAPNQGSRPADANGRHGDHSGGHFRHEHHHCCFSPFWGVGVGIGLGAYYDGGSWYQGGAYYETLPIEPGTALPAPIIYPRNGQSPEQTEADRQDCNRWAVTQPDAVAGASAFQRATAACMDVRGYTVR